jgi:hypothetical protein
MKWEDEDLDLGLRELRDEPWPEERLAAWREGVRQAAQQKRRRWWLWLPVPALAAAAAAAFFVTAPLRESVPAPALMAEVPAVPPVALQPIRQAPAAPPQAVRLAAAKLAPARSEQTEFISIVTDDPDVVILWAVNRISSGKGEMR